MMFRISIALLLTMITTRAAVADGLQPHGHDAPALYLSALPHAPVKAGQPVKVLLNLKDAQQKPLGPDGLRVVHTEKFHLLVIDPSLSDYHHIHPAASSKAGEYVFHFTPLRDGPYRLWADITPSNGSQHYVYTDLGEWQKANLNKDEQHEAQVGDLFFTLALDTPLQAGKASLATIEIKKDGVAFEQLEPVMGAFAHGVGFNQDASQLIHVHPMGKEPKTKDERGGPMLRFHIMPEKAGFIRFFVQVQVNGKNLFAPFGLNVEEAK